MGRKIEFTFFSRVSPMNPTKVSKHTIKTDKAYFAGLRVSAETLSLRGHKICFICLYSVFVHFQLHKFNIDMYTKV